jgi:hypothetical protein
MSELVSTQLSVGKGRPDDNYQVSDIIYKLSIRHPQYSSLH